MSSDRETVRRQYLRGELDEAEQQRLEELLLSDDDEFEAMLAAEDDLVDEYVRGEMSPDERAFFDRRYGTSPQFREKVSTARALAENLGAPVIPVAKKDPADVGQVVPFRSRRFGYGLAAAATLSAFIAGGVYLSQRKAPASATPVASRPQPAPVAVQPVVPPPTQIAQESVKKKIEPPSADVRRKKIGSVASLVFAVGAVRSESDAKKVDLAGAEQLRIRIDLDETEQFAAYRAEVRDPAGTTVWAGDVKQSGSSAILEVPASKLAKGRHEIMLSGSDDRNDFDEIGFYYFSAN